MGRQLLTLILLLSILTSQAQTNRRNYLVTDALDMMCLSKANLISKINRDGYSFDNQNNSGTAIGYTKNHNKWNESNIGFANGNGVTDGISWSEDPVLGQVVIDELLELGFYEDKVIDNHEALAGRFKHGTLNLTCLVIKRSDQNFITIVLSRLSNTSNKQIKAYLEKINKRQLERKNQERIEEEKRIAEWKNIISKTYDLQEVDSALYERVLIAHRKGAVMDLKDRAPSFNELIKANNWFYRSQNCYEIIYRHSRKLEISEPGYTLLGKRPTNKFATFRKVQLTKGNDTDLAFFKNHEYKLPVVQIKNIVIEYIADFGEQTLDYCKGFAQIRVKAGKVSFIKHEPDTDIAEKIENHMMAESNGKYTIRYEIYNIMGEEKVDIQWK